MHTDASDVYLNICFPSATFVVKYEQPIQWFTLRAVVTILRIRGAKVFTRRSSLNTINFDGGVVNSH